LIRPRRDAGAVGPLQIEGAVAAVDRRGIDRGLPFGVLTV
jgi:hypothetical protein